MDVARHTLGLVTQIEDLLDELAESEAPETDGPLLTRICGKLETLAARELRLGGDFERVLEHWRQSASLYRIWLQALPEPRTNSGFVSSLYADCSFAAMAAGAWDDAQAIFELAGAQLGEAVAEHVAFARGLQLLSARSDASPGDHEPALEGTPGGHCLAALAQGDAAAWSRHFGTWVAARMGRFGAPVVWDVEAFVARHEDDGDELVYDEDGEDEEWDPDEADDALISELAKAVEQVDLEALSLLRVASRLGIALDVDYPYLASPSWRRLLSDSSPTRPA